MRRALLTCLLPWLWAAAATAAEPTWAITAAAPAALGGGAALAEQMTARGIAFREVTDALRAGQLPLDGIKVLVIGSFVTSDAKVRETLLAKRAALADWLAAGGVVVQFGQQDQAEPQVSWLPEGLLVTRADPDYDQVRWLRADHPLSTTPNRLDAAALSGWHYRNWGIAWEALTGWDGCEVIADCGTARAAAVIEAEHGRGRLLLLSVSPDSMTTLGEGDTPAKARAFLANVLAYAERAAAGRGVALKPTPRLRPVVGPDLRGLTVTLLAAPQSSLPGLLAELKVAHGATWPPTGRGLVLIDAGAAEQLAPGRQAELAAFAQAGGVVVELAQNQDRRPVWLPDEQRAGRGGMPSDSVAPGLPDHPLFALPNELGSARLNGWRDGVRSFARQPLAVVAGWGVLATAGGSGSPAVMLERAVGQGRVVLAAIDPAAAGAGDSLAGQNARAILSNLLRHGAESVRGGTAIVPPVTTPERRLMPVGRQVDGSVMVPSEQLIVPAGRQVEFSGRPIDVGLLPDGRTLAVVDRSHLRLIDTVSGDLVQSVASDGGHSVTGLAITADGRGLYTTTAKGTIQHWTRDAQGKLAAPKPIKMPAGIGAGLALSGDEKTLYVAGSTANALFAVDLAGAAPARRADVGMAPFAVARAAGRLYVSNWGGRRPKPGETTADSAGSQVLVDQRTIGRSGTVSVLEETTLAPVAELEVGLLPSGMAVSPDGRRLYVANANSDTVSVIDTGANRVVDTISVKPNAGLPYGSATSALTISADAQRLYVAESANNAVAVVDLGTRQVLGHIPTGWYPGAVALNPAGSELYVANVKGVGSLAQATRHNSHHHQGSVSLIALPDAAELARLTARAAENNRLSLALAGLAPPRPGIAPRPLPERHGEPSVFRHVIYIIRENRTYDQVMGDMPQGNGDASLVHFGREVTPNSHALAEQFGLLDNFYCSGVLSADGHQWTNEAYVSSYLERMFGGFFRSYPYEGNDALAYSAGGFLWDNALAHGKTFRSYGEMVHASITPRVEGQRASFKAIHDDFVADGKLDDFEVRARASIKAVQDNLCPTVIGFPSSVPDIYRASEFVRELREFEANGKMPNLCMMLLPNDHTAGTTPGMPTPRAAVADNDLALGRIVEAVSRSRFWPETAIFVVQDDPQAGVDHVDGHRSPAFVISPYSPRGKVISDNYTQVGLVKTIELLLGLPPMNQLDLAAEPMRGCFVGEPDLRPYTALPNRIALDELNPPLQALSGEALHWAKESLEEPLDEIDEADEDTLNQILWHFCMGDGVPYPRWALLREE